MRMRLRRLGKFLDISLTWLERLAIIVALLFMLRTPTVDNSRTGRIRNELQGVEFNYIAWEVEALWAKAQQTLFGYYDYIGSAESKIIVIDYLVMIGQKQSLDYQIEQTYTNPTPDNIAQRAELNDQRTELVNSLNKLQPFVEPLIEDQVEAVLKDMGFNVAGQVLPPVRFRFVVPPDILVISPRAIIQQDLSYSLRSLSPSETVEIEERVTAASPTDSAFITGIGGVGIYPAIVDETRFAAFAYEIVAHEWSHHYLFLYPSGLEYLVAPETRIINETTATVFGNAVGLMVLERFYSDEVAQGLIYIPDYPTLEDFFPTEAETANQPDTPDLFVQLNSPDAPMIYRAHVQNTTDYLLALNYDSAAQNSLDVWSQALNQRGIRLTNITEVDDRGTVINRTRLTADYLLQLQKIDGAEDYMSAQGRRLDIRRLNQAWFAFYEGYQAEPSAGGGVDITITDVTDPNYQGDPIGPAIQEIYELAPSPYDFLVVMRDITTRQELLELLIESRQRWGS